MQRTAIGPARAMACQTEGARRTCVRKRRWCRCLVSSHVHRRSSFWRTTAGVVGGRRGRRGSSTLHQPGCDLNRPGAGLATSRSRHRWGAAGRRSLPDPKTAAERQAGSPARPASIALGPGQGEAASSVRPEAPRPVQRRQREPAGPRRRSRRPIAGPARCVDDRGRDAAPPSPLFDQSGRA